MQLWRSPSSWTSKMSQKCLSCTQGAQLVFPFNHYSSFMNHSLATLCWGMVRNSAGVLVPQPNAMESRIRKIVTMHDEDYSRVSRRHTSKRLDFIEFEHWHFLGIFRQNLDWARRTHKVWDSNAYFIPIMFNHCLNLRYQSDITGDVGGYYPPLQLRFGNGDIDALPLVLPPVPGGKSGHDDDVKYVQDRNMMTDTGVKIKDKR